MKIQIYSHKNAFSSHKSSTKLKLAVFKHPPKTYNSQLKKLRPSTRKASPVLKSNMKTTTAIMMTEFKLTHLCLCIIQKVRLSYSRASRLYHNSFCLPSKMDSIHHDLISKTQAFKVIQLSKAKQ